MKHLYVQVYVPRRFDTASKIAAGSLLIMLALCCFLQIRYMLYSQDKLYNYMKTMQNKEQETIYQDTDHDKNKFDNVQEQLKTIKERDIRILKENPKDSEKFKTFGILLLLQDKHDNNGEIFQETNHNGDDSMAKNFIFLQTFLSGFCDTASPGFLYRLYLAYGKPPQQKFRTMSHLNIFIEYVQHIVATACMEESGVVLVSFPSENLHSSLSVLNQITMDAYLDDVDYYVIINYVYPQFQIRDWAEEISSELQKMDPTNTGVVLLNINNQFSSCLHKTHFDIFGFYNPQNVKEEFADFWISQVYPEENIKHFKDFMSNKSVQVNFQQQNTAKRVLADNEYQVSVDRQAVLR